MSDAFATTDGDEWTRDLHWEALEHVNDQMFARPKINQLLANFKKWRDVAEFERKELLKVRVYRSLRQASAALLSVAVITVIFSILDIEIIYAIKGKMIEPMMPPIPNQRCEFQWNSTETTDASRDKIESFLKGISFSVRVTISALTVLSLCLIWWYTELERRLLVVRHHLSDSVPLFNSPLAPGLYVELLCCIVHVPPCMNMFPPEWQLITFVRLYHIVKYMREHHPMRYHRMTEILKTVASVKLSSTFLLKSYFLKKPLPMLMALYFFNLFAVGYIVFALERSHGTCMLYKDVVWMIGVTITNLGFGDFTPSSLVSRCMICMLSLFGIFQTALIVGVLSEALVIPPDEKRILASVEKQRADQIRRHAAAKLIQATWRQHRIRDGRNYNRGFINALWQWRKVKTSTDTVGQSLEKEFLVDDTAITTTYISRKLDALEKFVRKGPGPTNKSAYSTETPKSKWLNAARDGINKKHMMTKLSNLNASNGVVKQVIETVPQKLNNETVALENETKQRTQQTVRNVLEPKKQTNVESDNKRGISAPQYEIIRKLTDQIGGLETKQSLVNNEIDSIKALLKDLLDENSTPNSPIPEVNVADYDVDDGGDSSSDDSGPRLNQNRRCTNTHNSARRGAWAAV